MSPTIHPTSHSASHSKPTTSEPKVLLEDLTAGLLWTNLLRAPSMAFSPARWLLGIVAAFMIVLVTSLHAYLFASPQNTDAAVSLTIEQPGFQSIFNAILSLNPAYMLSTIAAVAQDITTSMTESPWTSAAYLIPLLLVLGVFGYAITRSASIQYAHGRQTDATSALSDALRTIRQIALATLGPLLVVTLLAVLIMLLGLPLGLPIVNILGGVLYALSLILAILIVCILTLHTLTLPLIISGLAIEGTDGFDALQRAYAYLIARPIRLAIYAFVLVILGTTITTVVITIAGWSIEIADALTSTLTNDAGRRVLAGADDMGATEPFAHTAISLFRSTLQLIVAGYILSLTFCSSTLAYLNIRRVCDGQETTEVWDPISETH